MDWETKTIPFTPTAVSDRTVTGIFSVFGNTDAVGDIAHPGSFTKTFAEAGKKALYLWHHNEGRPEPPVAVIQSLREVPREALPADLLTAFPDATGGAEVTRDYLDTPRGNELLTAIKAGAPLQQSYGFKAVKWDYEQKAGGRVRHLWEQRLGEVSDVLWGANPATRAQKSAPDLDSWLAEVADLLDQAATFEALLTEIKSGARHSTADVQRLNAMHDHLVALGCTNCPTDAPAQKAAPPADAPDCAAPDLPVAADPAISRAAQALTSLAELKAQIDLFDLSCYGVR